jgi:hypothetical protein
MNGIHALGFGYDRNNTDHYQQKVEVVVQEEEEEEEKEMRGRRVGWGGGGGGSMRGKRRVREGTPSPGVHHPKDPSSSPLTPSPILLELTCWLYPTNQSPFEQDTPKLVRANRPILENATIRGRDWYKLSDALGGGAGRAPSRGAREAERHGRGTPSRLPRRL